MENDDAILQDLESCEIGVVFQIAFAKVRILLGKLLQYPKMDIALCHIKHPICPICSFCFYNINYNPPRSHKT